jgi:hypothetical protein
MLVEELHWSEKTGWRSRRGSVGGRADLVLYFGALAALSDGRRFAELHTAYPDAHIVGGSASATVMCKTLYKQDVVAVAVRFDDTRIAVVQQTQIDYENSRSCGEMLGRGLAASDLAAVFVIADGLRVNGSMLTAGLKDALGDACPISGGMASDSCRYEQALAGADMPPAAGVAIAIGFYGPRLRVSHGSRCGWDAFGPRRRITRSHGNTLLELDGKPAFELYQRYFGDELADGLSAGVLFPLLLSHPDRPGRAFVRAALGLDQSREAMKLAGNVPEGWMARLMRGSLDRLALAAAQAARDATDGLRGDVTGDRLALIVSCTGRMMLMGQRTIEEVDYAFQEIDASCRCLGFYSYGEIAPTVAPEHAELHNQTMTVTGLAEMAA